MTDLRTAAQQALEALEDYKRSDDDRVSIAMHILCTALAEPNTEHSSAVEPVQEPDSPERRCGGPGCDMTCCQPVQEPVAFKDAPERIWLQACEDDHCEVPFCEHNEITWCAEQQNPLDVQYVRADLAAPPKLPAEPQGCDHCEHPLYAGTRETLRLVDELALCAELKREYQEQFAQAAVQRDALLEALRELLADAEFLGWDTAKARAAIAKAEENT